MEDTQPYEITEYLENDSFEYSDSEPAETSPADGQEALVVTETNIPYVSVTVSEVTTSIVTTENELLTSVQNIEQLEMYKFGILLVGIAVALSVVIIKSFFGKEL